MKVAGVELEIVKPKLWDGVALAIVVAGALLAGANLHLATGQPPGEPISGILTLGFVVLQFGVCLAGLLVLGKTAKEGTLWGNLLAVAGMLLGMSGVFLAAALWTAA